VQRDTNPEKWYPRDANGNARKFDDLPAAYRVNVDVEPPFGGHPGDRPALSDDEIDDVAAFMRTLTDGFFAGEVTLLSSAAENDRSNAGRCPRAGRSTPGDARGYIG
jgi:hypothetical protein